MARLSFATKAPLDSGDAAIKLTPAKQKKAYVTFNDKLYPVIDVIKTSGKVLVLTAEGDKPIKASFLIDELNQATGLPVFIEIEGKEYSAKEVKDNQILAKRKKEAAHDRASQFGEQLRDLPETKAFFDKIKELYASQSLEATPEDILVTTAIAFDIYESNAKEAQASNNTILGKSLKPIEDFITKKFKTDVSFVQADRYNYTVTLGDALGKGELRVLEQKLQEYFDVTTDVEENDDFCVINMQAKNVKTTANQDYETLDLEPVTVEVDKPYPTKFKELMHKVSEYLGIVTPSPKNSPTQPVQEFKPEDKEDFTQYLRNVGQNRSFKIIGKLVAAVENSAISVVDLTEPDPKHVMLKKNFPELLKYKGNKERPKFELKISNLIRV
nr:MAG TPA: hypothetical protein [Bacteriophage sp.]